MKLTVVQAAVGSAAVLLSQPALASSYAHRHAHNHYGRSHLHAAPETNSTPELARRATCSLPNDPDLVSVPGASNNGFAMSPDQICSDGGYCPFACVPGKVMAQWKPGTTYVYPESQYGGVLCNGGTTVKPFPNSPYCVEGTGTVTAVNDCGKVVSFCQTVLPGNEAMLIPTDVTNTATLAVPGISYWDSTAAHYYINPPGVDGAQGCVWGDPSKPIGNWAPFVAGANTDASGLTYVKIGWNPIFTGSALAGTKPTFGVKIECPQGGCNGLPCSINPATDGMGGVESPDSANGAGGAAFCVVTVPQGQTANIVVFNTDGSSVGNLGLAEAPSSSTTKSTSTSTTSTSTTSIKSTTSTTSVASSTTTTSAASTSVYTPKVLPGIFQENGTAAGATSQASRVPTTTLGPAPTTTSESAPATTSSKNEGGLPSRGGAAILGLIVAFVATAVLY